MLTQAEIDALLSGAIEIEKTDDQDGVNLARIIENGKGEAQKPAEIAKEEDEDRQVRPYNFWSPDRFSKDHMRAIELLHEELGERLTNTLPTFLRTSLNPRIVHTEQGRFHEFLSDMNPNSLFHLISLAPLPGQFLITISQEIAFSILEQRLGGRSTARKKNHILTDIDQSIMEDMVENMLNDIKASWGKIASVEPKLVDSTTNQHWVQMMVGNERVMMITFEMVINAITGTMSFYLPYSMLKPIINELNPHIIISGRQEKFHDANARRINQQNLSKISLPIRVILGKTNISLQEMKDIEIGDVIVLDKEITELIPIEVVGKPQFAGSIGKSNKCLAVQIQGKLTPDGQLIEV